MPTEDIREPELSMSEYVDILLRRRWIFVLTWAAVLGAAVLYAYATRPVFEGDTLIDIEKPGMGTVLGQGGVLIEAGGDEYFQTQYRLLKSDTLTQKVYDDLRLATTEDFEAPRGVRKLQDAITIAPVPKTRLAYVEVQSHDPDLAIKISRRLADSFVEQNLNSSLFMSREVLQALQLKKKGADTSTIYESLPSVVDNKLVQTLKDQKITLEGQIADLTMRYTPYHPQVIAAKSRLNALQNMLDHEIQNVIGSLKAQLSGELLGNNVRVIDPARMPDRPVKPNKPLVILAGIFGGMILGLFSALFIELFDQSVRTEHEVERRLHRTFLGVIPYSRPKPKMKVYEVLLAQESSLTSEAFRNLRTMVDFAGVSERSKSLLVTSTVQEEGKSFVATNLAVAFAQLGEKVLLIDGDLRRPRLHRNFGLSAERGMSDYLLGSSNLDDMGDFIQKTDVPNLSVIGCGPRPPNPSELLNTPKLSALIAWAQERYQRVFIDCTPVFPISDVLLWGRYIRCAVYVVRSGSTRATIVRSACSRLDAGGVKILGVVINGSHLGGLTYSGGHHYEQYYYTAYAEQEGSSSEKS